MRPTGANGPSGLSPRQTVPPEPQPPQTRNLPRNPTTVGAYPKANSGSPTSTRSHVAPWSADFQHPAITPDTYRYQTPFSTMTAGSPASRKAPCRESRAGSPSASEIASFCANALRG